MHDKNVYILGAGFSAEGGAPLLRDFLQVAQRCFHDPKSGLGEEERKRFAGVFRHRQELAHVREAIEVDLENVEHLFGILDLEATIDASREPARDDLVYLILRTLELGINWKALLEGETAHAHLARALAPQDCVITFNYDLQLDVALRMGEHDSNYCLRVPDAVLPAHHAPRLLKLHGSANWFQCTNCAHVAISAPSAPLDRFLVERFREPCNSCHHMGTLAPIIVPPGWRKPGVNDLLIPVWQRAVAELRDAQRLAIVGYSMPESDIFFRYLLALGIDLGSLDRVMVLDISEDVIERYKTLFDEVFRTRHFWASAIRGSDLPNVAEQQMNRPRTP